jgi:hypothetical protein
MKHRAGFVSNSSSSSFILNGAWIKVYGTGIEENPDCIYITIVKTDRYGFPVLNNKAIKRLQKLFSGIRKVKNGDTDFESMSYMYEDSGCFYGDLYGDDMMLAKEIKKIVVIK